MRQRIADLLRRVADSIAPAVRPKRGRPKRKSRSATEVAREFGMTAPLRGQREQALNEECGIQPLFDGVRLVDV